MCGIDFVPPFQGLKFCCHETQGVALGCHVVALSARVAARSEKFPTIFITFSAHGAAGLKARNKKAQGNALGIGARIIHSPERARQKSRDRFVLPFQGASSYGFVSQGVALGYHVIALSARDEADTNIFQTRQKISDQLNFIL
jgi:hypothetical protein